MTKDVSRYDLWMALRELKVRQGEEFENRKRTAVAIAKEAEARHEIGLNTVELKEIREEQNALRAVIAKIGEQWLDSNEFTFRDLLQRVIASENPAWMFYEMVDALPPKSKIEFLKGCKLVFADIKPRFRERRKYRLLSLCLFHHAIDLLVAPSTSERTGTAG